MGSGYVVFRLLRRLTVLLPACCVRKRRPRRWDGNPRRMLGISLMSHRTLKTSSCLAPPMPPPRLVPLITEQNYNLNPATVTGMDFLVTYSQIFLCLGGGWWTVSHVMVWWISVPEVLDFTFFFIELYYPVFVLSCSLEMSSCRISAVERINISCMLK